MEFRLRPAVWILICCMARTAAAMAATAVPGTAAPALPAIRHVFVLMLENQSFETTFGAQSPAPYLATRLASQGALLSQYYGIGHWSLGNYVALISGQAPNSQTQDDCPIVTEFVLTQPALDADGQALGKGCVYPPIVRTLPDQLEDAGLTWKGYMEDMGNDPRRESRACGHSPVGSHERSFAAQADDKYAARHNPFVYFHRIIDDQACCDSHVVNLDKLPADLANVRTTPNFVFITPNLCNDGHDDECVGGLGGLGGFAATEAFLRQWVPRILESPAYKEDGLLIITFDESDGIGPHAAEACCAEKRLPGEPNEPGYKGPGGGRVGAVLLSRFIKPGTVSTEPYNHYSTLRTLEDLFGLEHLGYAGQAGLRSFGSDVFTRPRR